MRILGIGTALAVLLTTLCSPVGAATRAPASSMGADAVLAWNAIAMDTIVAAAVPVPEQPLYLAYTHRAVYSAVVEASYRHASAKAGAMAAAHTVLVHYFPAQKETLDSDYADSIATVPNTLDRRIGVTIGIWSAWTLIRDRAHDGRNGPVLPTPPPAPGVWVPTPPNTVGASSWLGSVRPFVLSSGDRFRAPPPPALTSDIYARAYNEVRRYGSATSTVRTPEQTEIARFWADAPYVQNQRVLRALVAERDLDLFTAARMFAMADTSAADALIACWDTKYQYWFWRPFTAIPEGDTDGNPATPADPGWTPLVPTPNHPEYASAHSCATSAMFIVLANLVAPHTDVLDIDMYSAVTGTTHHFATVSDLIHEVANARVWAGLHWRFSTAQGVRIGRSVARQVLLTHGNLG